MGYRMFAMAVGVAAGAPALIGCTGDPPPAAATTSSKALATTEAGVAGTTAPPAPTEAPATTAPADPEEAAILAAVDGYWQSILDANSPPNPAYPSLAMYATGQALAQLVEMTRRNQLQGLIYVDETPPMTRRRTQAITTRSASEVVVLDCHVDDGRTVEAATGRIANGDVATRQSELTLRQSAGEWKVTANFEKASSPGDVGC